MIFKVLKKDLKKKKSINIIITIFVFMATLFISSSINQLLVTVNGLDQYFDKAKVHDYMIFTLGSVEGELTDSDKRCLEFLEEEKAKGNISDYELSQDFWCNEGDFYYENGDKIMLSSDIISRVHNNLNTLFDQDNNEVKEVEDGYCYVTGGFMNVTKLKIGDSFLIRKENGNGLDMKLTIKGRIKDAACGGDLISINRVIVSENDMQKIIDSKTLAYAGIVTVDTVNKKAFSNNMNKSNFTYLFAGDRQLMKTGYIMDVVVALLLFLVSAGLVLIAVLILRFTIVFTINDSYKEIGIMKAIGIKDKKIRKIYIVKYSILTVAGAIIGFIASLFVGKMLTKSIMKNMVIDSVGNNIILQLLGSMLVVLIIIFLAYRSTKKVKKMKPLDAIRNGAEGERFKKKGLITLKKKKMKTTSFLAFNDLSVDWKRFLIPILTSVIGIWLLIMPANTINTLCSKKIAPLFGFQDCDYFVSDSNAAINAIYLKDKNYIKDGMERVKDTLDENGIKVKKIFDEIMYRFKIRKGDNVVSSVAMQGIGTDVTKYIYNEGTAPQYVNEVAVTKMIADKLGAHIGDTVYIANGGVEEEYIITAYFQSMSNMGEGIRFHQDVELSLENFSTMWSYQIILDGEHSKDEIKTILAEKLGDGFDVVPMLKFIQDNIGSIIQDLKLYKIMVIIVVALINIMVIMLMQRTFMTREKSSIATLKSVGYSNKKLIFWQAKRMGVAVIIGVVIGALTSGFFTDITSGLVFKFMGANEVDYEINIPEVYVIYPIILIVMSVLACMYASRRVKKIDVRMMNVE
ncbi:MAG: FtsX-like permease family protein [Eubacterium sp.]|nr:FtsX-like permease family protein [Eubacterium sp.]